MEFIDWITHNDGHSGHRDMVDLAEAVVKFYFHPSMKGSYSIKKVLPAVLNSSEFIRIHQKEVFRTGLWVGCHSKPQLGSGQGMDRL